LGRKGAKIDQVTTNRRKISMMQKSTSLMVVTRTMKMLKLRILAVKKTKRRRSFSPRITKKTKMKEAEQINQAAWKAKIPIKVSPKRKVMGATMAVRSK
jgi:hypothetical protein